MSDPSRLIRVGRVAGAFGVTGEVRITAFTESPKALLTYKELLGEDGAIALTLTSGRVHKDSVVARTPQIASKEEADAKRGLALYVRRDLLPEPEEDEFYLADLFGLKVLSPDGTDLGRVKTVRDFGAGDILEIQPKDGQSWWIAFTRETVPEVRIADGVIVVARPDEVSEKD